LNLVRVPDDVANVVDIQTDTFPRLENNYDTIQFALNRRFTNNFFVQGSFDYQWRDEFRAATGESTSPLTADPIDVGSDGHGTIWQTTASTRASDRRTRTGMRGSSLAYNLFNSNPETNFTIRTGGTFENIIAVLDPRAFKLGVGFQF